MAEYLSRDTNLWVSKLPETAFNTPPATGADFLRIVSINPFYILPDVEKTDDANRVGTGTEFATHVCNGYWSPTGVGLQNDRDFYEAYGRLWLRAFGGTVTSTAAGTGFEHSAMMQTQAEGIQLPSSSFIAQLGPADVMLNGLVVETAQLTQQAANLPVMSVNMLGSGKHARPNGMAGLPAPSTISTICPSGQNLTIKYTKPGGGVVDLGETGCRFKSADISLANNNDAQDRCPGDPELLINGCGGNYVRRISRGQRNFLVTLTLLLDDVMDEYKLSLCTEPVTDVTVSFNGPLIGAGPERYAIGAKIAKANFRGVAATDVNGKAAYSINLQALDPGPEGFVINTEASGTYK
jgi:hypothetical protein